MEVSAWAKGTGSAIVAASAGIKARPSTAPHNPTKSAALLQRKTKFCGHRDILFDPYTHVKSGTSNPKLRHVSHGWGHTGHTVDRKMVGDALVKVFALELPSLLCAVCHGRASRLSSFCEMYFLDSPCYSLL